VMQADVHTIDGMATITEALKEMKRLGAEGLIVDKRHEDDEYVRVDGRWLHSAMRLTVAFMAPHDRGWAKPPRNE